VRRELARFGGLELDTAGDGFFASFDGPARGIACARAIVASAAEEGIQVRAGLHTGECEREGGKRAGSRFTSAPGSRPSPSPEKFSYREP